MSKIFDLFFSLFSKFNLPNKLLKHTEQKYFPLLYEFIGALFLTTVRNKLPLQSHFGYSNFFNNKFTDHVLILK